MMVICTVILLFLFTSIACKKWLKYRDRRNKSGSSHTFISDSCLITHIIGFESETHDISFYTGMIDVFVLEAIQVTWITSASVTPIFSKASFLPCQARMMFFSSTMIGVMYSFLSILLMMSSIFSAWILVFLS